MGRRPAGYAFGLLATGLLANACTAAELYRTSAPMGATSTVTAPQAQAPRILSAHFSRDGVGDENAEDELLVVFSTEVDPATLDARAFIVVLDNGDLARCARAILDPADEYDENRTVTLIGKFGDAKKNPPVAVRVMGNLYAEDGRTLDGLDAELRSFEEPDELVWIEVVKPEEHRCAGARQVVRTYWTDNLRDVGADDLTRVTVSFTDGSEVAPTAFDDHASLGGEVELPDDNVLDLCLGRDAPVSAVSVSEAAFGDRAGHPSAKTQRTASVGG
jgi:hypothetical protein